jgi:chemotaxis response regulator CheB
MAGRDIVVIGASAGGVTALRRLLPSLPPDFRATVFVALHRWPHENLPDSLPDLLALNSPLTPRAAVNGKKFAHGEIYVAPADTHLLVDRGVIRVECSPRESHTRPSVDALFRSAAMAYGRRVVGVVLTGMLDDGTVGLWQIRKYGGIAIVQDPAEAEQDAMPPSAIENVPVHYSLPLKEIAWMLGALAAEPPSAPEPIGPKYVRLLIVEDERNVAKDLANRLQRLGYSVVGSVSSGEDAIGTAAATMPDLVLMDVSLAGKMRGTDAAAILWQQYQLPVVFVTASDKQSLDEAKQSMPYGYIVKPYSPDQIRAAIEQALDRYGRVMDVSVHA